MACQKNSDVCCSNCDQLTSCFDVVVQKPWHLSAINNACVRICHHFAMAEKEKFSPEMDIFLPSARLCEILTTRSGSLSPDAHHWAVSPGVVTADDCGTAMLHEILLSALPSSLPRKLHCEWVTAATGFLFPLGCWSGHEAAGPQQCECHVPACCTALSQRGQDAVVWWGCLQRQC